MKLHVALVLALFTVTTQSYAVDCKSVNSSWSPQVGQISPKKVRAFLMTADVRFAPELAVFANNELLDDALNIGMHVQNTGNESMVYNVDGLIAIAGDEKVLRLIERQAIALEKNNGALKYYSALFQVATSIRVIGSLRLMNRTVEAQALQALIGATLDKIEKDQDAEDLSHELHSLRMFMSNTGKFKNAAASTAFCERITAIGH